MADSARIPDLAQLADLVGLGLFQVDEERNVVAVSAEMERITGFTAGEVLGRSCLSLVRCPECLRGCGVFERGSVRDARLTLYRKDGSEIEVLKSGRTLTDESGAIRGAVETIRPVDEEAGGGCAAVPPELDAMLRGLGRMYVAADAELRAVSLSPGLADILGRSSDELEGVPLEELFGIELFGPAGTLARAVLDGERREGCLAELHRPDGSRVPVSLTVGPVPAEPGCRRAEVAAVVMLRLEQPEAPDTPGHTYHGILARSPAMQQIFRLVELLRGNDAAVLIGGESGTGKELVARAIHETSHRSERPFVAVNCAAIPAQLMESELFGHVRGAFTGAVRDRVGRFEAADGGTLFLDEVGDLPLELQGKLLRAIQQRAFERVGENRTRTVDVRVIAATNKDLGRAVAEGRFRDDLYYRLRVIPLTVPPLRHRREDIPLLLQHFLGRIGQRHGRALRLSPGASRVLLAYGWPGNVRELENVMEYAITVCEGQTIHVGDLPRELHPGSEGPGADHPPLSADPPRPRWDEPVEAYPGFESAGSGARMAPPPASTPFEHLSPTAAAEARAVLTALEETRFRRAEAAELLGISRTTLWRKMREYGL